MHPTYSEALQFFGLFEPITRKTLEAKRQELLLTWNPHRFANLTNNPKKYMQMYKKGEAMTKQIEAAYQILLPRVHEELPRSQHG